MYPNGISVSRRWVYGGIAATILVILVVVVAIVVSNSRGDEEEIVKELTAAEISSYEIVSQGVYYRSNNLRWYEMTDYIEEELVEHFDSLRNVGYLTPGNTTVEVQQWDGSAIDCDYTGDINPDGEAHGIGKAVCPENNASFDGQFMFDVVHGKQLFKWANFGTAIYEYRQGDLHGKEVLFIEGLTPKIFNKYYSKGVFKDLLEVTEEEAWYNIDGSIGTASDANWQ